MRKIDSHTILLVWVGIIALSLLQTYALSSPIAYQINSKPSKEEVVHLIHADKMMKDQYRNPDAQILKGNVQLSHAGMRMTCDSAVLYQATNSVMAVGKVVIVQGDTLSLHGDSLFYDGTSQLAQMYWNVEMKHRKSTLFTDKLYYNRLENRGFYDDGGKLVDGNSVLTSVVGDYFTDTRNAVFNIDVQLVNQKKDTLITDTLNYDTQTKWAHATGPSNIYSGGNRIYTENGFYNTENGKTRLYDRPQLFNQGRKLIADSILYNKETRFAEAFYNIFFEDLKNKSILQGDYGYYDEPKGEAMVTLRALGKDFSNELDTLFIHADTLRMYSYNMKTDSAYRKIHGYPHVRSFRSDVQAICDSLVFNSQEKKLSLYKDPIVWSDNRQILGEEINVFTNDSTIDSIYVQRQALLVEKIDSTLYNQVAGHEMRSYYKDGEMTENQVEGNVILVNYPMEKDSTYLYQNYCETAKMRVFMINRKLSKIWAGANPVGVLYPIGMAPPEKTLLPNFAWFDDIRPIDKYDIFEWRGKKAENKLKFIPRREAPLQILEKKKAQAPNETPATGEKELSDSSENDTSSGQ